MSILMTHEFVNHIDGTKHLIMEVEFDGTSYLTALDLLAAVKVKTANTSFNNLLDAFNTRTEDLGGSMKKTKLTDKYSSLAMIVNARKGPVGEALIVWLLKEVFPKMEKNELNYIINERQKELANSAQNATDYMIEAQFVENIVERPPALHAEPAKQLTPYFGGNPSMKVEDVEPAQTVEPKVEKLLLKPGESLPEILIDGVRYAPKGFA